MYRTTSYLKSALWIVPFVAIALVLAMGPVLRILDAWLGWRLTGLDIAAAQGLYQTVITLTLSFMVFTFGSLLVSIQVASGQLTPRIIATMLLRDNVVRYSVGLFVFTLVFAVMSLNRLERNVPQLVCGTCCGTASSWPSRISPNDTALSNVHAPGVALTSRPLASGDADHQTRAIGNLGDCICNG